MSFDALAWAAKQSPGSSAAKLVLLGLAECASRPDGLAFPSIAALVEFSCLDRKTVIAQLDRLEASGLISDTGRRAGKSQRIKVYLLHLETVPKTGSSQKRDHPKNGREIVPKTVPGISKGISASGAKAPSASRATSFPDNDHAYRVWCIQWAVENMRWSTSAAGEEFERFHDNSEMHGRKYIKWQSAWRNWCRSPFQKTAHGDDGFGLPGKGDGQKREYREPAPLKLVPVRQ